MIYLLIAIIVLQVADFATTYIILARGGREKNSFLSRLMHKFGTIQALLLSKLFAVGLCVVIYLYLEPWILAPLVGWYSWVIWHNIKQVRKTYD